MTDSGSTPNPVLHGLETADLATGSPFPLAAMIFGWPPATDNHTHTSPEQLTAQQEHPGAWLQHFASEQADADVWRGLLLSCKAGRVWALQAAHAARFTLDCTFTQPKLRRVGQSLRARGSAPTSLVIKCEEGTKPQMACQEQRTQACLAALPEHLAGCGSAITDLSIETGRLPVSVSSFLHSIAPHLHNLTTLHVHTFPSPLPDPSFLPSLTSLAFSQFGSWDEGLRAEHTTLCSSVAAYIGQLTHLRAGWPKPWPTLFTPATTAHRLTSFTTSVSLTAELLGLLLKHAPQLQRLSVQGIDRALAQSDAYRQRQWGVQQLTVACTQLSDIAALPQCLAGKMNLAGDVAMVRVTDAEGIPVTITERWERWHIEGTCLSVEFYFSIPIADQPAAVRNTLQQLSRLPAAAGTTLQFSNYWWTAELAEAMAAVLPGLPQYQISVSMLDLTDEMLRIATAMGPCVHELATSSLQSQSLFDGALLNGPSVPWMGLSIGSVELSTLTRRIDPDGAPLLIRTDFVDLDNPYGQDEERLQDAVARLSKVYWAPLESKNIYIDEGDTQRISNRRGKMRLLQAMQFGAEAITHVTLCDWCVDQEAIAAFQGIPDWVSHLTFHNFKWPLEPAAYVQLGRAVPPKCRSLKEEGHGGRRRDATLDVMRSICVGAKERMMGVSAERLVVELPSGRTEHEPEWFGEHVVLRPSLR